MRESLLIVLIGCLPALALEPEDVHGFWNGESIDLPGSQVEIFFASDGKVELRTQEPVRDFGTYTVQAHGDWVVKDDSLDINLRSGWTVLEGETPEPFTPDTEEPAKAASVHAETPRRLEIVDCPDEECPNQDLLFVGAARAFTLPEVSPTSIRHRSYGPIRAKARSGNRLMTVWKGLRVYDLQGRQTGLP